MLGLGIRHEQDARATRISEVALLLSMTGFGEARLQDPRWTIAGRGAHRQQPALQAQCQDQRVVRHDRARARAARAREGETGDRPVESADRPAAAAGRLPRQPGGPGQLSRPVQGAARFRRDARSTSRATAGLAGRRRRLSLDDQAPDDDWPEIAEVVDQALCEAPGRAGHGRPGDGRRADRAGPRRSTIT